MTASGIERVHKEKTYREDGGDIHEGTNTKTKEEIRREIEEQQKELDRKKKELEKADSTYKYKPAAVIDEVYEIKPQAKADAKQTLYFVPADILMMRFGS